MINSNIWVTSDKDQSIFENAKIWCIVPKVRTIRQKIQRSLYEESEWKNKYSDFATYPKADKNEFKTFLKHKQQMN